MSISNFEFSVFGKTIIAGEHTVIRGGTALVAPVKTKKFDLKYKNINKEFETQFLGDMSDDLSLVFWGVLDRALKIVKHKRSDLHGDLILSNSVPVGAGLGASATLCVGIGRFFEYLGFVNSDGLYEFCRQLENLFHGESSGVDIAATLAGAPIIFSRPSNIQKLDINWNPKLYLSYCGQRGMTSECVKKVKTLWESDAELARKIDEDMKKSVELAQKSFLIQESDGIVLLIQSMNMARSCFERWGLTEGALDQHMKKLSEMGALALKPTGSGRGGYVLSLWKDSPPASIQEQSIPVVF